MHEIGMTIDAGHTALFEHGVRCTPVFARWANCIGIVTASASDTVLGTQLGLNLWCELRSVRLPVFLVFEIVRQLHEDVTRTGGDMRIRFNEPVGCRNVAVGTTCDYSLAVAPVLRALEVLIRGLEDHGVARGAAKGIGRRDMVDHGARYNTARADHSAGEQYSNEWPSIDLHC